MTLSTTPEVFNIPQRRHRRTAPWPQENKDKIGEVQPCGLELYAREDTNRLTSRHTDRQIDRHTRYSASTTAVTTNYETRSSDASAANITRQVFFQLL